MGYSVPETQSAPAFFLNSYPQVIHRAGQGVGVCLPDRSPTPPVEEYCGGKYYTPQQKIFAKVKAAI